MRLNRIAAGEYRTPDGSFRIVNRWGDARGWTVLAVDDNGDADVRETYPLLRDARAEVDRLTPKCPHGCGALWWVDDSYYCPRCGDEWDAETIDADIVRAS